MHEPLPRGQGALPTEAVRFLERAQLLDATARSVAAAGCSEASIADITRRAGVSRRTFYEYFPSRDAAVIAAYEAAVDLAGRHLRDAFDAAGGDWLAGVRGALATYVALLACEDAWARFCIVEAPTAVPQVTARREVALAPVLDRLSESPVPSPASPITARGVVEAIDGVLRVRIAGTGIGADMPGLQRDLSYVALAPFVGPERAHELVAGSDPPAPAAIGDAPPLWLVDDLVALLPDQAAIERLAEVLRAASAASDGVLLWRAVLGLRARSADAALDELWSLALGGLERASFFGLPLRNLSTKPPPGWGAATHAHRCLEFVAEHPGASGRAVREGLGIAHASQVSRLLNGLERDGYLRASRTSGGKNAWVLTSAGRRALDGGQRDGSTSRW